MYIMTSPSQQNKQILQNGNTSGGVMGTTRKRIATTESSHNSKKIRVACLWSPVDDEFIADQLGECLVDPETLNPDPSRYKFTAVPVKHHNSVQTTTDLVKSKNFDVFIFFCDGTDDHDSPDEKCAGVEVLETLIRLGAVHSGPTLDLFNLTKRRMKQNADEIGVETPPYFFAENLGNDSDLENFVKQHAAKLKFPLIVKHHNAHASKDMHEHSKANNMNSLLNEVRRHVKAYGAALVEEFITGREFTVLICENADDSKNPIIYTPFECCMPDFRTFKHCTLKFVEQHRLNWVPCTDEAINRRLSQMTKDIYEALDGNFYARCDFRMCEKTNVIYFLEINIMPSVLSLDPGSADFILKYQNAHKSFLENIVKLARVAPKNENVDDLRKPE